MCHVGALSKALGILVRILGPELTDTRIFISMKNVSVMGWSLGLGMLPTGTFPSPVSASLVVEVRDLHHEVRFNLGIIFMYNMSIWGGSWGSGCGRRARFCRRRRRRRS